MDGAIYTESKPIKNTKEAATKAKEVMSTLGDDISKNSKKAQKAISDAKIGDKISSFWGKVTGKKKKEENVPTADVEDLDLEASKVTIIDHSQPQSKEE